MEKTNMDDDEELFVTLTLDDDSEVDCEVIAIYEAEGKDYIALLPTEGQEHEEGEVFIYKYYEDENGDPGLDNIETDEEYDIAAEAFDQMLDEAEYDEEVSEEE